MRNRSVFIMLIPLLTGFLIGIGTSALIRNYKLKEFRAFNSMEGFKIRAIGLLQPEPDQEKILIPVIEEYAKRNVELKKRYHEEFLDLMKEYRARLYPLLSNEQIRRLEDSWKPKDKKKSSHKKHPPEQGSEKKNPPPD